MKMNTKMSIGKRRLHAKRLRVFIKRLTLNHNGFQKKLLIWCGGGVSACKLLVSDVSQKYRSKEARAFAEEKA